MNADTDQNQNKLDLADQALEIEESPEQIEAELDAMLKDDAPAMPASEEYLKQLDYLTTIHAEIAGRLNSLRETRLQAFKGLDDEYIPETGESLRKLDLAFVASEAEQGEKEFQLYISIPPQTVTEQAIA
jgi:hypothetical protein